MSNISRHPKCEHRTELGNYLPIGGFCTAVPTSVCEAERSKSMGFRCPKCKKDFGSNKDDFQKHLLECTGNTLSEYEASALVNSEEQAKQAYVRSLLDFVTNEEQEYE